MKHYSLLLILFLSLNCLGMEGGNPPSDDEGFYESLEEESSTGEGPCYEFVDECEDKESSEVEESSDYEPWYETEEEIRVRAKKRRKDIAQLIALCNTRLANREEEYNPTYEISSSKSLLESEAESFQENGELQIRGNWRLGALPNGCFSILHLIKKRGFIISEDPAIYDVAISPDDQCIATSNKQGIAFWRTFISKEEKALANGKGKIYDGCLISRFKKKNIHTISWSPDGQHLHACYEEEPSIEKFKVLKTEDGIALKSLFKTSLAELQVLGK